MRQNLGRAIGYTSLALPIGGGVLEPNRPTLQPASAAIAMARSRVARR